MIVSKLQQYVRTSPKRILQSLDAASSRWHVQKTYAVYFRLDDILRTMTTTMDPTYEPVVLVQVVQSSENVATIQFELSPLLTHEFWFTGFVTEGRVLPLRK
mmetsp:Transcript_8457/g.12530  ORF Transcript_8457/g.12530 Transcript_8457/m.12530 type:complete len:102 (+) Transcript_8457:12-317(+)